VNTKWFYLLRYSTSLRALRCSRFDLLVIVCPDSHRNVVSLKQVVYMVFIGLFHVVSRLLFSHNTFLESGNFVTHCIVTKQRPDLSETSFPEGS